MHTEESPTDDCLYGQLGPKVPSVMSHCGEQVLAGFRLSVMTQKSKSQAAVYLRKFYLYSGEHFICTFLLGKNTYFSNHVPL